ncbi:NAD-dependent epimerase/dehydratase family protein [Iamia sp.]|uniref:NAD-dependent epimerase/dehydratase family protein n=1 Tax=Iamia sp. TaxID=2722710 RepID=UPI002BADF6BC|nr:NAD-dependent epimerase/dehydratase family protein [Iamia sp.]HXH55684.1 NAD-dependent epimerase/dehydratase family protein [Iamia sp.]
MGSDGDRAATAIVTGAGGWLGQNLVRALAPERRAVRCLVARAEDAPLLELVGPSVEVLVGDVRDPSTADRLFAGAGPATVFHAAGVIHPDGRTRTFFDVNVGGTQYLLDRARRAQVGRFLHVSSNSVFGANPTADHRFTEDSPFNPYLGYGESKLEAEELVRQSHDRGDLETVILRPPWFYGPHQPDRQTQFFAAVRKGRFPMVGDGRQRRSMAYTASLVSALLLAETADAAPGQAYWIADAEPYELRHILDSVRTALAAEGLQVTSRQPRIPAVAGAVAARADALLQGAGRYVQPVHVLGELRDTIACDISKARRDLGYEPVATLVEGMRTSIRWCLERGARL